MVELFFCISKNFANSPNNIAITTQLFWKLSVAKENLVTDVDGIPIQSPFQIFEQISLALILEFGIVSLFSSSFSILALLR